MGRRKYSKKALPEFTDEQREWARCYEASTGFEPMYLDEVSEIGFDKFAKRNIDWFEEWMNDAMSQVSSHVPWSDSDFGWKKG